MAKGLGLVHACAGVRRSFWQIEVLANELHADNPCFYILDRPICGVEHFPEHHAVGQISLTSILNRFEYAGILFFCSNCPSTIAVRDRRRDYQVSLVNRTSTSYNVYLTNVFFC